MSRLGSMNGRERYDAVLAGRPPDEIPRIPILMQWAAEFIGSNYGAFASDHRVLVGANLACAAALGLDQVSCISDPYREAQGFGARLEYRRDAVPAATAPLADDPNLSRLPRPDPRLAERMRDRLDACLRYSATVFGRYSILGWVEGPAAEAAALRGAANFLVDLIETPDYAAALMNRCLETGMAFARAQIEGGADTIGIGDAIASQVSPEIYEALIQPRERQLVAAVHGAGARARLHICGNITHLLPAIAQLGVDILDVDHPVSLAAARTAVGPHTTLAGNVDPVSVVQRGPPPRIRDEVRRCWAEAGPPFMVNAGCEIPSATPIAHVRALCEPLAR